MPSGGKLTLHQKILNACASLKTRKGLDKAPRKKVASLCGFPRKESGSYMNALRLLQKKGYVTYDKEYIEITDLGMKHADHEAPLGSNKDALEEAKAKFKSSKMKQILDIVFDGDVHLLNDVRVKVGASNLGDASWNNVLGPIKKEGYIEKIKDSKTGKPAIKATIELFPFGHPHDKNEED